MSSAKKQKTAPDGKKKVALITGITGQDGSYLAEFLLRKNYMVHGIIRRSSSFNTGRIEDLYQVRPPRPARAPRRAPPPTPPHRLRSARATLTTAPRRCSQDPHCDTRNLFLHYGDLTDSSNCFEIVNSVKPDELYNLGAQSHVKVSFEMSEYTADTDGVGVLRLLNAMRSAGIEKTCKFYQASTSELYGQVQEVPQRETTPFYPRSPYAVAKQYAYWMIINYREAYGMHLSNGILFNHESPRRGPTFVTRKVTRAVARIHKGLQQCLYMGNIDAKRDWGHARDYVEMMWMMLQQDEPDDYVVATCETNTVRLFIETAFKVVGVGVAWRGEGVDEVGYDKANPARELVKIDPKYFRPTEVELLIGDPTKAKQKLGWTPKVKMEELCREMVEADIKLVEKGDLTS